MIRKALLAALLGLAACAGPPQPTPHADGRIVEYAVQQAQARADAGRGRAVAVAAEPAR